MSKMKREFFFIGSLAVLLCALGCAGVTGETKGTPSSAQQPPAYSGKMIGIAVMDFETKVPNHGWEVGHGASDMLTTALVKTKKYRCFERDKIESIMKEQNFQMSGAVDTKTAVQVGKLIGVKYIITGAVTEYGLGTSDFGAGGYVDFGKKTYKAAVDVRAVNVETGEIIFADSGSGELKSTNLKVMGIGGGESFDEKKATESMRMAIDDLMKKIYLELN
jgi:curli biogenesis system outer membrane secretion channel CsgG